MCDFFDNFLGTDHLNLHVLAYIQFKQLVDKNIYFFVYSQFCSFDFMNKIIKEPIESLSLKDSLNN